MEGRLLVARHSANGDVADHRGAVVAGAVPHLREHGFRHPEEATEIVIPAPFADVVEHGARGIGGVGGVDLSAGQVPQQETVDGAGQKFAASGAFPGAFDMIENPGDLGAREIGIRQQARALGNHRGVAFSGKTAACAGGSAVLPDNCRGDRPAGGAIPDDHGFPLVGDAHGGDGRGGPGQHLAQSVDAGGEDVLGILFNPAGLRKA